VSLFVSAINQRLPHTDMILIQRLLNKSISVKLAIRCTLSLGLMVAPSALAAYVPGAQNPVPKDRRSDAGTTRGCSGGDLPLTVLASRNYVGQTTSRQPTFAWFVPRDSASKPMRFVIYELVPNGNPNAIHTLSLQSSPGVMKLSPFSNTLELQPGKEYLWQVVIQCDPDNPSGDLVSQTILKVVTMPASVQSTLKRTVSGAKRANIYAEAGLWYDALGEALTLAEASKLGTLGSALLNDLAQSEASTPGLPPKEQNAISAERNSEATAKQIVTLKQIAVSDR
jgi:Domain of Unknown Function (DUF928)